MYRINIGDKLLCNCDVEELVNGDYYTIKKIEVEEITKIYIEDNKGNHIGWCYEHQLSKFFDTLSHIRKLKLEKLHEKERKT